MSYYFRTTLKTTLEEAIEKVTEALKLEGFGILTEIDVQATFKKKLDVDFRPYRILGACNPNFAYQALQTEDWIGTMLPCNVVVQEMGKGHIEIAAVDPVASMGAIENSELGTIAKQVRERLQRVIASLS